MGAKLQQRQKIVLVILALLRLAVAAGGLYLWASGPWQRNVPADARCYVAGDLKPRMGVGDTNAPQMVVQTAGAVVLGLPPRTYQVDLYGKPSHETGDEDPTDFKFIRTPFGEWRAR